MKRTVYIFSDGELRRKDNTLFLETKEGKKYIPIENTNDIYILGEVTINKRLLEFLLENKITMHFFNFYGFYIGSFYPKEHLNSGYMLLKQVEHYLQNEKRMALARQFVNGAVDNIEKVLAYYSNRGKQLSNIIENIKSLRENLACCENTEQLMAIEGNIRENYYQAFDIILDNEHFVFEGRTKRPPKNRLNALISFANSLVYTTCLSEIYHTHLDPRIGYLHSTNFRRFTLNLDIAEIFKPILADRVIFNLVNKNIIKPQHFEKKIGGIVLNDKGKQILIKELDERLRATIHYRKLKRHISYRQLIRIELYKLQKHLIGEQEYKPFVTGW